MIAMTSNTTITLPIADTKSGFSKATSTFYSKRNPIPHPPNQNLDVTTFISSHAHHGKIAFSWPEILVVGLVNSPSLKIHKLRWNLKILVERNRGFEFDMFRVAILAGCWSLNVKPMTFHLLTILDLMFHELSVAPAELEALLLTHSEVVDAAVISFPDKDVGQFPMAYVEKKPDSQLSTDGGTELLIDGMHIGGKIMAGPSTRGKGHGLNQQAKALRDVQDDEGPSPGVGH